MNFDSYQSHLTPPPQNSCRGQNAWVNTKAGETQHKDQARDARRKREELQRISSVSQGNSESSSSSDSEICLKKKRDEIQKEIIGGNSADLAPEAVAGGSRGSERRRSYGKISVVGRRREMEDVVVVELGFLKRGEQSYDFFGVYDGNGGWRVAHACGQVLPNMLAKIVEEESGEEIDWEAVMAAGFSMMEAEVNKKGAAVAAMVSSAAVAVVGENEVVVANCGASRVVLSSEGATVKLLEDDKPDERVEVPMVDDTLNWNGQRVPPRGLEPKVRAMRRSHADEFLILGSDGLWDVIADEFACQVARRFWDGTRTRSGCLDFSGGVGGGGASAAAAFMAELAVARGSNDNISIIVVDLKDYSISG